MPDPEFLFGQVVPIWSAISLFIPDSLLAYGPAPGMELIPYFLGLAAWAGLAFLAILLSPFTALIRRLRGAKKSETAQTDSEAEAISRQDSPGEAERSGK